MENKEIKNSTTFIEFDVVMLPKSKRDYNGKHITLLNLVERKLEFGESNNDFHNAAWAVQQDIYIMSNEKIESGDWHLMKKGDFLDKSDIEWCHKHKYQKVIATTDKGLDSIPNLTHEFIQKYIHEYNKGNEIKKVLVEFENAQSCSLYPEKCCGNPLDSTNEGECVKLQNLFVSKDNTINAKLVEKLPKQYDEDRLFNLLQDFLTIPENSIKEHIKLWIKENLKK